MIVYLDAPDISERIKEIVFRLELDHVRADRVACYRSKGSSAKGTIARCHALPKIMQKALQCQPFYIIEVISEEFDEMPEDEQTRTLVHELLHIPLAFGGGFKHHDFVNDEMVERFYKKFMIEKEKEQKNIDFKDKLKDVFKR